MAGLGSLLRLRFGWEGGVVVMLDEEDDVVGTREVVRRGSTSRMVEGLISEREDGLWVLHMAACSERD